MIIHSSPSKYPLIDNYITKLPQFSEQELAYVLELQKIYKAYEAVIVKKPKKKQQSIFTFFAFLGVSAQVTRALKNSNTLDLSKYDHGAYKFAYIVDDLGVFRENLMNQKDFFLANKFFSKEYFNFTIKSQEVMDTLQKCLNSDSNEQRILGKSFLMGIDNNQAHSVHHEELVDIFGEAYQGLYLVRDKFVKAFMQKYAAFLNHALITDEDHAPSGWDHTAKSLHEILDKSLGIAASKIKQQRHISGILGLKN